MDDKNEKLADDILISAEPISDWTGLTVRQVYAKQKELGLTHLGGLLIGTKSGLKKRLTGQD